MTNAIREKPFAVVLFDEIEKAHPPHPRQISADPGRRRPHPQDAVPESTSPKPSSVFTSNLGIYRTDPNGQRHLNIQPDAGLDEIRRRVRIEIDQHFKVVLNRPEILNRIGENIVVFDFIRPEIAVEIFDSMIASIVADLQEIQGICIQFAEDARDALKTLCLADLSNGGRGIRNQVEAHFVNPLARTLFDLEAVASQGFRVVSVISGAITTLTLARIGG